MKMQLNLWAGLLVKCIVFFLPKHKFKPHPKYLLNGTSDTAQTKHLITLKKAWKHRSHPNACAWVKKLLNSLSPSLVKFMLATAVGVPRDLAEWLVALDMSGRSEQMYLPRTDDHFFMCGMFAIRMTSNWLNMHSGYTRPENDRNCLSVFALFSTKRTRWASSAYFINASPASEF